MNSGASGSSLRCRVRPAIFLSSASRRSRAAGSSRPRTSSLARAGLEGQPAALGPDQHAGPSVHRAHAAHRDVGERPRKSAHSSQPFRAAPWKSLTGSSTASSPSRYSTIIRPRMTSILRDPVEVDPALVAQLLQHERLVVEVLGAHEGDAQHHGVDPVGPGGPAPGLHGPEPLHLAGRAHHGDAGLGPAACSAERSSSARAMVWL